MKSDKSIILIGICLIIVISALALSTNTFPFKELTKAQLTGPGFTVDTISVPSYITPDTDLSGVWFLISTTFNSGGESIVATITPEDTKIMSGYKTKFPITISVSPVKETVTYPIVNDGNVLGGLYDYRMTYSDGWILQPDPCLPDVTWTLKGGFDTVGYSLKTRLWCIRKTLIGVKGHLESPQTKWSADIILTTNGQTASQKITRISSEDPSVILSDRASASWTGSLVTGDQPPIASNYVATFLNGNYWKIGYAETWNKVSQKYSITDSFFQEKQNSGEVFKSPGGLQDPEWTRQFVLEGYANDAYAQTSVLTNQNIAITSDSVVQNAYSKDSGKVVFTPNVKITNQKVNFRVRADWVGIYFETGQPRIESISSTKFGSGETGSIILTVRNIGDGQGIFVPMLSGCPTFTQKYTSETLKKAVAPNTVETFIMDLSHGTVNNDIKETCTIKVYDYKNPSHSDSKSVSVEMTHSKFCTPNQYSYEGNVIYQCKADGSARNVIKTCTYGVGYKSDGQYGGYYCKEGSGTPPPTITQGDTGNPDITYKDWTESSWLLIGILITLISGLYILSTRSNKHGKK